MFKIRRIAWMLCVSSNLVYACGDDSGREPVMPQNPAPPVPRDCADVAHGEIASRTRFEAAEVVAPAACTSELQEARCEDGRLEAWTGSYAFETCDVLDRPSGPCAGRADGETVTRTRYAAELVAEGTPCEAEEQVALCKNQGEGLWSGSYEAEQCTTLPSATPECSETPDGETITRTRFASAEPAPGEPCLSEQQVTVCVNRAPREWSGTFTAETCTEREAPLGCGAIAEGDETTRVRYRDAVAPRDRDCADVAETQRGVCTDGRLVFEGTYTEESCAESYTDDCGTELGGDDRQACLRVPSGEQAHQVRVGDAENDSIRRVAIMLDGAQGHALDRRDRRVELVSFSLGDRPVQLGQAILWEVEPDESVTVGLSELRHGMRAAYTAEPLGTQSDVIVFDADGALQERLRWDNPDARIGSVALTSDALWAATEDELEQCSIYRVSLVSGATTRMNDQLLDVRGNPLAGKTCVVASDGTRVFVSRAPGEDDIDLTTFRPMVPVYGYDVSGVRPRLDMHTSFASYFGPSAAGVSGGLLLLESLWSTDVVDLAQPAQVRHLQGAAARAQAGLVFARSPAAIDVYAVGSGVRHMYSLPRYGDAFDVRDGRLIMGDDEQLTVVDVSRVHEMLAMKHVLVGDFCRASGPAVLCGEETFGDRPAALYVEDASGAYTRRAAFTREFSRFSSSYLASERKSVVLVDGTLTVIDHETGSQQTVELFEGTSLQSVDGDFVLYGHDCGQGECLSRMDLRSLAVEQTWPWTSALLHDDLLWTIRDNGFLESRRIEQTLASGPLGTLRFAEAGSYGFESDPIGVPGRSLIGLKNRFQGRAAVVDVTDPARPILVRSLSVDLQHVSQLSASAQHVLVRNYDSVMYLFALDGEPASPVALYGLHAMDLVPDGRLRLTNNDGVFMSEVLGD